MRSLVFCVAVALSVPELSRSADVIWADWRAVEHGTVLAEIALGTMPVRVTYVNSAGAYAFAQLSGGRDYWQNGREGRDPARSPFTSTGPDGNANIPNGTDIIGMSSAATHRLDFGRPVWNVYFSFVSINGNTITFDREVRLLSAAGRDLDGNGPDDSGFWGAGDSAVVAGSGHYVLHGNGEGHGTLFVPGMVETMTFTTSLTENWHGFTVGVASAQPLQSTAPGAQ